MIAQKWTFFANRTGSVVKCGSGVVPGWGPKRCNCLDEMQKLVIFDLCFDMGHKANAIKKK
jgi:hypothetical protein